MFSQRGHCSSAITQPRAAAPRQDLLQLDVCTCARRSSLFRWWGGRSNLCAHGGASVWVLICAYICSFFRVSVCVCTNVVSQLNRLVLGLELQTVWLPEYGAPQSRLMMCERRGEQIRTVIPQHADTSWRLTHMCTHTHRHTETDGSRFISSQTVRLPGECLSTGRDTYHLLPHTIAIHGYTLLS